MNFLSTRFPQAGETSITGANPAPDVYYLGLDVGSTTLKAIGLDRKGNKVFVRYLRHFSNIRSSLAALLKELAPHCRHAELRACMTGSAGLALAKELRIPFLQEVLACRLAIDSVCPEADVVIELGGEDAKVTYLTGSLEQRMNETCAGGTGAFIDQMAAFIGTDVSGLDRLALGHDTLYPLASRCGVFAKSDILPLLNEGCRKENIAASIMQAVVSQTISGLAQGRPIRGNVVFLGGPLHFLRSLRERFVASLPDISKAIFPENGHFFVALGTALHARDSDSAPFSLDALIDQILKPSALREVQVLPPLFPARKDLRDFRRRHNKKDLEQGNLQTAHGNAWLGLDCGSTTIKAALVDENGRLLYSSYSANRGDPLNCAISILKEIYARKSPNLTIKGACSTGYGGPLLAAGLHLDLDEVETVAHYQAASFFNPQVTFVLDIGGQDIKCLHIRNGFIERISLNEACSAGCGSFLETFANSLDLQIDDFIATALKAREPADLGSRCTVFMNSRVKQAQKEGSSIGDIAAGLAYSVARNAIFKVMRISDPSLLGNHIVVQGGAFHNEALLRALELELGTEVVRPSIAGLMGAFGAALIAQKALGPEHSSTLLTAQELQDFTHKTRSARCRKCSNSCLLTISTFPDGKHFVSGNRCERGAAISKRQLPNLYAWKYDRLFSYQPLPCQKAQRGIIGIPRVLNIYENYPLWFTLFTCLKFRVEISDPSSQDSYFAAFDTIPSQTVCFPAKLAHGHIQNLVSKGIKNIFFPCISREQKDADFRHGIYNCPVVGGYPELIALNMSIIRKNNVNLFHDFLPLDRKKLAARLATIPLFSSIAMQELEQAVAAAFREMDNYRKDLQKAGEEALHELEAKNCMGLILAGHPYHLDPEIHHGIPDLVNSCGLGVLTEDSVAHLMTDAGPLRVVDQWAYHSRLYRAGAFAATTKNLAVLQLVSFGCGLDAITSDQLEEIVLRNGRLYAQIKIDEGANLGPARIRVRSLLAAMREKCRELKPDAQVTGAIGQKPDRILSPASFPQFSREMKHTHTLLVPQLSPLHFQFAKEIFASEGYDAVLLPHVSRQAIELGLRYINNDACYPAIVVIGQLLEAISSKRYDPRKVALVISQTGGGCRATNYIGFLRRALVNAGYGHVPVANFSTTLDAPGIRLTGKLLVRLIMAGHYGDALMRVLHRLRPYEKVKGSTEELVRIWSEKARENIVSGSLLQFQRNMFSLVADFDHLPIHTDQSLPKIGLVGEILLKYHPEANNHTARIIEAEGGEAVVTDIMDFMLYGMYGHIFNYEHLAGNRKQCFLARAGIAWQELTRFSLRMALKKSKRFKSPASFKDMRAYARKLISLGHQTGEGWLLGAEMVHMLESGVTGLLCMQPFGCLPNHIVGKGLIRELKKRYPNAAIMALDYDPGASEVNQINRIKLMMRSGIKSDI